jgi:hypothetical protein
METSRDPEQLETRQTATGWMARLPRRGLAAQGDNCEQAIEEVRKGAALVDRLAALWTKPIEELAPVP